MLKNFIYQIGFEFEYFVIKNGAKDIEFPSKLGLETDEFPLIGEIRSVQNTSYGTVYGDFVEKWRKVKSITKNKGYSVLTDGGVAVSPELYKKALKSLGHKEITESFNIYGLDANDYSAVRTNELGKIIEAVITSGLHIHFSLSTELELSYNYIEQSSKDAFPTRKTTKVSETFSIKNKLLMTELIKALDEKFFSIYVEKESKYRQKGFYELKSYGFEYRSLPANDETLKYLPEILEESLKLFKSIYKFD